MRDDAGFALPEASTDLTGDVALVTGATSGLGWRFARVLASAGASVAITGRREERLEELTRLIHAEGGRALPLALDVTSAESITNVVAVASLELGPVNILVNNEGIPDAKRAHKMSVDLVDRVIDTNLRGPFLMSCEVARRLIQAEQPGRIVNITSMTGYHYDGHAAALYSITKAALARMTEVLAVEWAAHRINVNAIAPGAFNSEMMDGMLERMGELSDGFPRKRMGEAPQLDSTLLFLCAPSSEAVTGTIVKVDDGQGPR